MPENKILFSSLVFLVISIILCASIYFGNLRAQRNLIEEHKLSASQSSFIVNDMGI